MPADREHAAQTTASSTHQDIPYLNHQDFRMFSPRAETHIWRKARSRPAPAGMPTQVSLENMHVTV